MLKIDYEANKEASGFCVLREPGAQGTDTQGLDAMLKCKTPRYGHYINFIEYDPSGGSGYTGGIVEPCIPQDNCKANAATCLVASSEYTMVDEWGPNVKETLYFGVEYPEFSKFLACLEPSYGFTVDTRGVVMGCRDALVTGQTDCTTYEMFEDNYVCIDATTRVTKCAATVVPGVHVDGEGFVRQCKSQNAASSHDASGCRTHHPECFAQDSSYKGQPALSDTLRCAVPEIGWFHKDPIFEDDGYDDVVDTVVPCVPQAACLQSSSACVMPFDLFPRTPSANWQDFALSRELKCATPLAGHWVVNFRYEDTNAGSDGTIDNKLWVRLHCATVCTFFVCVCIVSSCTANPPGGGVTFGVLLLIPLPSPHIFHAGMTRG